jgi:predicted phosphodiesterase
MSDILVHLSNETEDQCLWRIGQAKDTGILMLGWVEIAAFLNKTFREDETQYYDSSAYRKKYRNFVTAYEGIFSKENFTNEEMMTIQEHKRELEKAKIKLRDERIDYQRSLREDARRESFLELIERSMAKNIAPFEYKPSIISYRKNLDDMVVCLSDLHAGIEVRNWWNTYDTKILKKRLHCYLDEIINIQDVHQCRVCHLVLGGDNISGLIHANLRLQNNENVVEQLKIAVTYIGEFIDTLQPYFDKIEVHSVAGNHSRLNPNKDNHLKGEELDDMIPFCLGLQFANNDKVRICDGCAEKIDSTISAFVTTGGKRFYIVHGDKDAPSSAVKNLTLISGTKPDGIIMGHRHHNAFDTEHDVKIIQCGSVVGVDDYCVDKRISGSPEQCVFITSEHRVVKCLYDIGLD